jgi:Protein of unknown function (DUF3630)
MNFSPANSIRRSSSRWMTVSCWRALVPIVVVGEAMTNTPWRYDGERNQPESKLPAFSISIDRDQRNDNVLVWVSREPDWTLFDRAADLLAEAFRGRWSEQADGLDQRYWDLVVGGEKVTLHLDHYLGISLFPAEGDKDMEKANELVLRMGRYLEASGRSVPPVLL